MILCYHHVAPREYGGSRPVEEGWYFSLTPPQFEAQLGAIEALGYTFVSLETMVARIDNGEGEDDRTAVVTFDDGWRDQLEFAVPILARRSIPAAFFVTTDHLRAGGAPDGRRMGREELRHLHSIGMTIGAHTRSHPNLVGLSPQRLEEEVRGSSEDLEQVFGPPPRFFAYPGGSFDARVVAAVRHAGYHAAVSTLGPSTNDVSSMFWLFRDTLSATTSSYRDRARLSPPFRALLELRVRARLRKALRPSRS